MHNSKKCSTFAPAFVASLLAGSLRSPAALAELVDAPDLGSGSERSESSSLLCRTTMKRSVLFFLSFALVALMTVSCNMDSVISPGVQYSSYLYRTSADGVQDTITLNDSLQVGDTVRFPMVLNGYYDYITSFVATTDTSKVHVSMMWDDAYKSYLTEIADPDNGILAFKPDQVYAFVTTLVYVPMASGTYRIDLELNSSAPSPYSQWAGHFFIGVK